MSSLNENENQRESLLQARGSDAKSSISQTASATYGSEYGATGTAIPAIMSTGGTDRNASSAPDASPDQPANRRKRGWSMHEATSLLGDPTVGNTSPSASFPKLRNMHQDTPTTTSKVTFSSVAYILVYAMVNVIISVPGLYGYAAVIFNHPVFTPHMNALSKLVILSSLVHQLGFTLFSSLPFAIGTVQDAGLIFLSSMSNQLATKILDSDGGTEEQVLSTTLALLSVGTASLGLVLVVMGHFRLADAVSYLPMPVVAGYLAYIGYFCLQAGVALCISKAMTTVTDWQYVLTDADNALLAAPGLIAGLLLTYLSRTATNDAILPAAMVAIPIVFYVIIWWTGIGLEGAREGGWVGEVNPPVPVSDLFQLVTFSAIRWDLINEILFTWVGMVFVVSFASCLDVAAISMDMGEALDTNKELSTVGICNIMSGLTFGFTGSYIFSQTIFTYRTQVHTRWIGICIMMVFAYVVSSPINILQVAPLFFLGSTLIFIGYDLVYEWLVEIRHKVFLSEYAIVWATFLAIQVVGMDAGIILGVLVAIVDHVVSTAKTTSVYRVNKKSRAVWRPDEYKLLQAQGYNSQSPKIVTLEIVGNVFFGSSLLVLDRLTEELGIDIQQDSSSAVDSKNAMRSPHTSSLLLLERRPSLMPGKAQKPTVMRRSPKFVVLELTQLSNLDASASRGCFLQVVKMCTKRGITVCAAGASPRIDWMMRSHEVAYETAEEVRIKALFQSRPDPASPRRSERILLFLTVHEALEFCENALIHQMSPHPTGPFRGFYPLAKEEETHSLASVFKRILGCTGEDERVLQRLNGRRYHDQVELRAGQELYGVNTHADSFYTVLKGAVAVAMDANDQRRGQHEHRHRQVLSGAGLVPRRTSSSNLLDSSLNDEAMNEKVVVASLWPAGSVFGHVDFLLERPRNFRTVATQEGTVVAKMSISQLHLLQSEEPALDALLQRVLLQVSILDLANCTCDE